MSTLYTRICVLCLAVLCVSSTMAYTSSDCSIAEDLVDQDILAERDDCRDYRLDSTISRQEVAAVALKVADACGTIDDIPDIDDYDCENIYDDVSRRDPNEWACRAVELLSEEGIFTQAREDRNGDRYFRPLRNITRAESLAVMLDAGDIEFRDTIYDNWRFTGTGAVSWQKPLMQFADDEGIITSISSFQPNQYAYRKDVFRYAQEAIEMCDGDYNNNDNDNNCGVGERASGNRCIDCTSKPSNSRYDERGTCDWTCNSGYRKSGNSCVYTTSSSDDDCEKGEYESNNRCYSCNSKPSNSKYTTYGSCSWTCNSGYVKSGSKCVRDDYYDDEDECEKGEYESNNRCYDCNSKPSNSKYTTYGSCSWTCNSGYYKSGSKCVRDDYYYDDDYYYYDDYYDYDDDYYVNDCGKGEYESNNRCYSCNSKPSNSKYTSYGSCSWTCNSGYIKSGSKCVRDDYYDDDYNYDYCGKGEYKSGNSCYSCDSKPSNSQYTSYGSCSWSCNSGYTKSGNSCVSDYNHDTCGVGYYWSGNSCYSCGSVPSNGYYTSSNSCDWTCNSGYHKSGNSCVSDYTSCGIGQYPSSNNNSCTTCTSAPANSYYTSTNSCAWSCNSGYTQSGSSCVYNQSSTNGVCGSSVNSCVSGTYQDMTDSSTQYLWSCLATGNGTSVQCSVTKSNSYSWYTGSWSSCSGGSQSRTVQCRDDNGNSVADSYCSGTKPSASQSCSSGGSTTGGGSSVTCSNYTVSCTTNDEGDRCTTNKCPVGCRASTDNRFDGYNDINHAKYGSTCADGRCVNGKNNRGGKQTLSVKCM